jgi:hypothetical protein
VELPGICDESTGTCIKGEFDDQCEGIADGKTYEGMETGTFCLTGEGFSLKASVCPAPPNVDDTTTAAGTSATSAASPSTQNLLVLLSLVVCFFYSL